MPTSPWVQTSPPAPDGEYLVLATYLPLTRFTAVPRFIRYSQAIRTQLAETPGLVGYSLRAALPTKRFYTLSAWQGEPALAEFVRTAPHRDVMGSLAPHMGATKFVRWRVAGDHLPPGWDEAMRRLDGHEPAGGA